LACHTEVIDLCRKEDVEFVCLPANSTDKLQPLNVSIFGPMDACMKETASEVWGTGPYGQASDEDGISWHAEGVGGEPQHQRASSQDNGH
jgi:hypothetical protein